MEETFPETLFVSECGSGENAYLACAKTEQQAIEGTDDEEAALVAEYKLVTVRNRRIVTSVTDADASNQG